MGGGAATFRPDQPLRNMPLQLNPRLTGFFAVALACLCFTATAAEAQRPAPAGFIGMAPQTALTDEDLDRMQQARIRSIRLPLPWFEIAERRPGEAPADWSGFDHSLTLAARHRMTVLPFAWGTPSWIASDPRTEPMFSARARKAWTRFLRMSALRYGPGGAFWAENPELPKFPIRRWQIWNEPNIVSFSLRPSPRRWARLLKISARAVRSVNPNAQILASGFFGRPLQRPNIMPSVFLRRALKGTGLKYFINGIAVHPYVPQARDVPITIQPLRRVLRDFGIRRMPLWVTEMGWGSDWLESRWERGWRGQARELHVAMRHLTNNRRRWKVRRVYWYSWIDAPVCQFCDSAGLFTAKGRAKPSWYAFNTWTGGDPRLSGNPPGLLPELPELPLGGLSP